MFGSNNGALPDHIIMNMPYLWSRNGKQFICHICENVYTRKYGLKIHLRTHNNNKPLECEVCKKTFRDPSNLVKHSKIHNKSEFFDSTLLSETNNATIDSIDTISTIDNIVGNNFNFKEKFNKKSFDLNNIHNNTDSFDFLQNDKHILHSL